MVLRPQDIISFYYFDLVDDY